MILKKNKDIDDFELGLWVMGFATIAKASGIFLVWQIIVLYGLGAMPILMYFAKEYNVMAPNWNDFLNAAGLSNKDGTVAKYKGSKRTDFGERLRFNLPPGLSIDDFRKRQTTIENFLNVDKVDINYNNHWVFIDVYREKLKQSYPFQLLKEKNLLDISDYELPVGFTYGNKPVFYNLRKGVHLLIAGVTGAGKSTVVRLLIVLINMLNDVAINLIDLKGSEFPMFEEASNVDKVVYDEEQALNLLRKIRGEVTRRNSLFRKTKCKDIESYNKKHKSKLQRIVVVIDELAEFKNKTVLDILNSLGALARSCGIHLICATQRPSYDNIPTTLRANLPSILGLHVRDGRESSIVGIEGLEKLEFDGHGILKQIINETEFRCVFLDEDEAKKLIKAPQHIKNNKGTFISKRANPKMDNIQFLDNFKSGKK